MRLCSIASGSSGNCIYVGSDNTHLLVDVGISGKRVEQGLNELDLTGKDIDGILITHEHSDHIKGLGVMARKYQIPDLCNRRYGRCLIQNEPWERCRKGFFMRSGKMSHLRLRDLTDESVYHFS